MMPQGMDMNQMQQMMMSNQLMMGMGINPNMQNIPEQNKDANFE